MDAGLVRGTDQKISRWRPSPIDLMGAAKLMDSFESVKIGENFGIGSKEMQAEREGGASGGGDTKGRGSGQPDLVWVIKRVWESGYIQPDQKVYFTTIRDIIKQAGLNVSSTQIRSALEMASCRVSSSTVEEAELGVLFDKINNERG